MKDVIQKNLEVLQLKLEKACNKSLRKTTEVELLAVSKTMPVEILQEALECGLKSFGENYAQEAVLKMNFLTDPDIRWHFVGHLQSNKARLLIPKVSLIHSVDRMSLAQEIEKIAKALSKKVHVLIEVNVASEKSKSGVSLEESHALIENIQKNCPHIQVEGLMSFPPYQDHPEENRSYFAQTRHLLEKLQNLCVGGTNMRTLSMGVSNDFEIAIEEGSTLVRVGSSLFGARNANKS